MALVPTVIIAAPAAGQGVATQLSVASAATAASASPASAPQSGTGSGISSANNTAHSIGPPKPDWDRQVLGFLRGVTFMQKRTAHTATDLNRKAVAWLKQKGLEDEVEISDIASNAVLLCMAPSTDEKVYAKMLRHGVAMSAIEDHNVAADGIPLRRGLWKRFKIWAFGPGPPKPLPRPN
jgi:hypothetical protein